MPERIVLVFLFFFVFLGSKAQDTLIYPINPTYDPTQTEQQSFDLGDPSSVKQTIVYDPITGTYVFKETIGSELDYRNPSMMTLEEYIEYERLKSLQQNWKERIDEQTAESQPFEFPIKIPSKVFTSFFGSDQITIRPQGSVELGFGVNSSRYDNPLLPVRQRRITRFDFQQNIQLNVVGQIGTRLKLGASYNTQAAFDFDNVTKLEYNGDEDQIIQSIALGNVSLDLPTTLIPGSQTLFGASSKLRFGRATVDLIAASSRGQKKDINIKGGAQIQRFELTADNYEANRHYFLNMYHHQAYDNAMQTLPIVRSGTNITRIEVWLTNRQNATENTRNIIAFSDLGEALPGNVQGNPGNYAVSPLPDNNSNGLYDWASQQPAIRDFSNAVGALTNQVSAPGPFVQAVDYEKVESAKKLTDSEFSYNAQLGYISLNIPLNNDEVLGVSYEYTYEGQTYQVGEFSTDGIEGRDALIMKLLKPTITSPNNKIWDLMMKNVYSLGAYQVDPVGFRLDILYNNPENSLYVPFFPQPGVDDIQVVTLLDMDKINVVNQNFSDGVFDFVPMQQTGNRFENGGTINARNGRIYFSTIEPFGRTLANKLVNAGIPPAIVDRIAYTELYDSTKTAAQQIPSKNRFKFQGEYQSSVSGDIPLNALNVPEGAVTVTAGGIRLVEGQDFSVDYNLGRVRILNEGLLASNQDIKISIESNSVFGFQAKSIIGSRFNYRFSQKLNVGGTWMRMMERPTTPKIDFGSEPYKNNIIGFDVQYRTEFPLLTKLVDLLPVISTKEKSMFSFSGEFAHLIPGQPRAINRNGTSYIDDFEGAQSTIDLRSLNSWFPASLPQGQPSLFPESSAPGLGKGFNRASTSWYRIDNLFYQNDQLTPQHIKDNPAQLSDSRMRLILNSDIFPNQNLQFGAQGNISTLDIAYYPKDRGIYNYDTTTANVDADGLFTNPTERWGGVMRALTTNDFELANIEYIQFWVMDPFNQDAEAAQPGFMNGGDLYFNLGNVSEDILPDSRKSYENGLPISGTPAPGEVDYTQWAEIPNAQVTVNAFDNDITTRKNQDVGLDGHPNIEEVIAFPNYINWVNASAVLSLAAKARMIADPSSDDYNFYRDDNYDTEELNILQRYKKYNGMEGNSPTPGIYAIQNNGGYSTMGPRLDPDREDINQDNNLSETENYFQYRISMRPADLIVGQNYVSNKQTYIDGTKTENWYQFKIPIRDYQEKINGINDFRSIRFMRMFMKDFDEEVILRFARLELIRGEWRKFNEDLAQPGEGVVVDPNLTAFDIGAVNLEENASRQPVNYVIPPGIEREIDPSQQQQRQLNEQALQLEVCGLQDGDSRAAIKTVMFDVRAYKKLRMFVHGESQPNKLPISDKAVTVFIRLGTDFVENYYEYEVPLLMTSQGATIDTDVWPQLNDMEIEFDQLLDLKVKRNRLIESGSTAVSYSTLYSEVDPNNPDRIIRVKGSPNLQGIRTIMIGVRNPKMNSQNPWPDDGQSKCVTVWVNELRLTDFVTTGGSAAVAQAQIQGADFFTMSASGNFSGNNWGAVDSRVQERQREQRLGFDFNSNFQLGQFFGKNFGLSLPFFFGYSMNVINPEFDPFNPDVKLADYNASERREKSRAGQDFTERRSYNFTNVRKQLKAGAKPGFYRISNWNASYSYSELLHRNFNLNYDRTKTWTGNLGYNYSFQAKPLEPFKNSKFLKKSKWFALVRDINIFYLPKQISFTNDIMRSYNERQVRNIMVPDFEFQPVFVKRFTWNRSYNIGYDLTRNLKATFSANNQAIFEEGNNRVDRKQDTDGYREFKDSIRSQLATFGKTMDYSHNYTINYNLPLNKIPALDWTTASMQYGGTYNWQRAPLGQSDFGNTIQNNRNINMQAQLNFNTLYNKLPFFKKVLADGKTSRTSASRTSSGQRGSDGKDTSKDKKDEGKKESKYPKPIPPKPEEEMTKKEKRKWDRVIRKWERKVEREKARENKVHPVVGYVARLFMSVRNVSGTYTINDGTLLPGYNQETSILGFNSGFNAPMGGFVFGQQQYDIFGRPNNFNVAEVASQNDWLVRNPLINRQYTHTHTKNLTLRAGLEPMKDLTIELSANRSFGNNSNEFYRWNSTTSQFESQSQVEISTLTYTNVSIGSAFASLGKDYSVNTFRQLLANRAEVSQLLGTSNASSDPLSNGYYDGYSGSQQEVVIGAFLTSYTNRKINEKNINPIKNLPLPNWNINYNGLSKFPFMKKYVRQFVLKHGYSSTVSIAGMQTNLNATFDANGSPTALDLNNNFLADRQIQNVTMSERFNPLIGFDATWTIKEQGLITKFEISKDRSTTLSLNNNQLTEVLGTTYVFGSGYRFSKVKFPFKKMAPSDVNFRADFSYRDNLTVIRKIIENTNQATAGQKVVSIKISADCSVGKFMVVQLYYDQTLNTPKIATAFPTGNMSTGIKLRYNLAGVQ